MKNMKHMLSRPLAFLLAVLMVAGMVPLSAWAAPSDEGASIGYSDELSSPTPEEPEAESSVPEESQPEAASGEAGSDSYIHYLQMPDGSLLVLGEDGSIRSQLSADIAAQFIDGGVVDDESLEIYLGTRNSVMAVNGMENAPAPTKNSSSPSAVSVEEDAWIPADQFDFYCENVTVTEGSEEHFKNLTEAVKNQMQPYGGVKGVSSGYIIDDDGNTMFPTGVVAASTDDVDHYHVYDSAQVNGVEIHYIGRVKIGGTEYTYYTTAHDYTPDALFFVLDPNDEDDRIEVYYRHADGMNLNYDVVSADDNPVPEGWNEAKVFGGDFRPLALAYESDNHQEGDHPFASISVTIPQGYEVTIKASVSGGGTGERLPMYFTSQTPNGAENQFHEELTMGVSYKYNGTTQIRPVAGSESASHTEVIYVYDDKDRNPSEGQVTITATFTKKADPTFSATAWLKSVQDKVNLNKKEEYPSSSDKVTGRYADSQLKPEDLTPDDNNRDTATLTRHEDEEGGVVYTLDGWSFNTRGGYFINTGMPGYGEKGMESSILQSLQINGESVNVPMIADPRQAPGDSYRGQYTDDGPVTATTTLSTGAVVTLSVRGHWELDNSRTKIAFVRTYTLKVENCRDDITITGGSVVWNYNKEVTFSGLENVTDAQSWQHTSMSGAYKLTYPELDPNTASSADWEPLAETGNSVTRTNVGTNCNWFTDPIRFQRKLGYTKPTIHVYLVREWSETDYPYPDNPTYYQQIWKSSYEEVQTNDALTAEGLRILKDTGLVGQDATIDSVGKRFVELVNRTDATTWNDDGTIDYFDIKKDYNDPSRPRPYGYIEDIPQADQGQSTWTFIHGFAHIVEDSSFADGTVSNDTEKGQLWANWTDSIDDYYYLRTTKTLDQYMRKSLNYGQVVIEISAEPISAAVQYINNATDTSNKPDNTSVSGMPDFTNKNQDITGITGPIPEHTDMGGENGYNVVDNATVVIPSTAPTDSSNQYTFAGWRVVKYKDGGYEVVKDANGHDIIFPANYTVSVSAALEQQLAGAYYWDDSLKRNIITLEAVWEPSDTVTGATTPATLQYYIVEKDANGVEKETLIYEDKNGNVPVHGNILADVYADDGVSLSSKVLAILGNKEGSENIQGEDYLKDEDGTHTYIVYPQDDPDGNFYTQVIKTNVGNNPVLKVYLTEAPTVNVEVTKVWKTSDDKDKTSIPKEALPDILYFKLQQRVKVENGDTATNNNEWEDYKGPNNENSVISRTVGDANEFTIEDAWNALPLYVDNDASKGTYEYRVVEVKNIQGDALDTETIDSSNKPVLKVGEYTFTVTNPDKAASPEVEDGPYISTITNTYQVPSTPTGDLIIRKEVVYPTDEFVEGSEATFPVRVELDFSKVENEGEWNYTAPTTTPSPTPAPTPGIKALAPTSEEPKAEPTASPTPTPTAKPAAVKGDGVTDIRYTAPTEGGENKGILTFEMKATKAGEDNAVTIEGLPEGTEYKVVENWGENNNNKAGYTTTYKVGSASATETGATGEISAGGSPTVTITNTATGELTLAVNVYGPNQYWTENTSSESKWADKNQTFDVHVDFNFTNWDELDIPGTLNYTIGKSGGSGGSDTKTVTLERRSGGVYRANFEISENAGTFTITGIPAGVPYTVHEHVEDTGYHLVEVKHSGTADTSTEQPDPDDGDGQHSDTIARGDNDQYTFCNERGTGTLQVTKMVEGNASKKDNDGFDFTVRFYKDAKHNEQITDTGDETVFVCSTADNGDTKLQTVSNDGGTYTFTLKDDDQAKISNIPAGVYYSIDEAPADGGSYLNDYTVSHTVTDADTTGETHDETNHNGQIAPDDPREDQTEEPETTYGSANTLAYTNKVKPLDITVTKHWENAEDADLPSVSIQLGTLSGNGWTALTDTDDNNAGVKTLTKDSNWKYTFNDLPRYNDQGDEIEYAVREINTSDNNKHYENGATVLVGDGSFYTVNYNDNTEVQTSTTSDPTLNLTITNTYTPGTEFTVTKVWKDKYDNKLIDSAIPAGGVKVQLQRKTDGAWEKVTQADIDAEVTLDSTNNWTHQWTGLDPTDGTNPYTYRAVELNPESGEVLGGNGTFTAKVGEFTNRYMVTYQNGTGSTTITNKLLPATQTITAKKEWMNNTTDYSTSLKDGTSTTLRLQSSPDGTNWYEIGNAKDVTLDVKTDNSETTAWQATWIVDTMNPTGTQQYQFRVVEIDDYGDALVPTNEGTPITLNGVDYTVSGGNVTESGDDLTATLTNTVVTHTVTFNQGDHGTFSDESNKEKDKVVVSGVPDHSTLDSVPGVEGNKNETESFTYTHVGWYKENDPTGKLYTSEEIEALEITGNMTFTAVYEKNQTPVTPPGGGGGGTVNPPELIKDDHIQYLFGYPDRTFGPERNMTRAEAAQMFHNLLEKKDYNVYKTFSDIPAEGWYTKAVTTMAGLGIVNGYPDGTFRPNEPITRAEFVSMAVKFLESPQASTENKFSDVSAKDWFWNAVQAAVAEGWINGYEDGTFRPNRHITRTEVASIVNHVLERAADENYAKNHKEELNTFTDVTTSHWGYYHIVEATNWHDYTKYKDGKKYTETWHSSSYELR